MIQNKIDTVMNPGEIWRLKSAPCPNNSNKFKTRPVLIIGDDSDNNLDVADVCYCIIDSCTVECCIISASSISGKYDVEIIKERISEIGLDKPSIIKTTKIYTHAKTNFNGKIGNLPKDLLSEFFKKYKEYTINKINELEKFSQ